MPLPLDLPGLAFVALVSVPRYAEGPAIVRVEPLEGARPELLVFLPARHLPSLVPGMTLRLELDGWPRTYPEATVETVGRPVHGPAEARRLLGPRVEPSLPPWSKAASLRIAGVVILLAAYIALFERVGFLVLTFALLSVLLLVFAKLRWAWAIGLAALMSIANYALFKLLLGTQLPAGILG